jgi:hypothetical protein
MAKSLTHKTFFSMRRIQVNTTLGHSAVIEPMTPTPLHRDLWAAAFNAGAMEFDPALIKAAAAAVDKLDVPAPTKVTFKAALALAVDVVLARKNPNELNKQGVPKPAPVRKEMTSAGYRGDFKKLTTSAIYDTFLELMPNPKGGQNEEVDETDLEDEDGIAEQVGGGVAALVGEDEGEDSEE